MLHAIIMAGGSGTRFWPESRRQLPKQFLKLGGDRTLLQSTWDRCQLFASPETTWIVTNAAHAEETRRQIPELGQDHLLEEPCGRNTAPCVGLAAVRILQEDPDATLVVVPADHAIEPPEVFADAVRRAMELITHDPTRLILFGVPPTYPATGFGYIQRGKGVDPSVSGSYHVEQFREKPDMLGAARLVASGDNYWNCGIFVWRAQTILDALSQYTPEIVSRLDRIRTGLSEGQFAAAMTAEFPSMPSISIDYAVLEKAENVCVLEAPFQWDDVGSWQALARMLPSDSSQNIKVGQVCAVETEHSILRSSDGHLIATIGVKDLIIVHTPNATLVADRRDEAALRRLIQELNAGGYEDYL